MKIDKEYPATHSMSTAWYIVDDDGNVGILDYNENGPIPKDVPEEGVGELVWGLWDDGRKYNQIPIELTHEQIMENLSEPYPPSEEMLWVECIVRIDKARKDRFLMLSDGICECICISEEEGLYIFDAFNCTCDNKDDSIAIIPNSSLDLMLKENLIIENYKYQDFWNNDTFNSEKNVPEHSKSYNSCSFFIYHQPYWENFLPEKMSMPKYPVKFAQLPDEIKDKVHHIPGNFNELETFQIAEYYPCDITHSYVSTVILIDGSEYDLLPLPDGTKAYLLSEPSSSNAKQCITLDEFERLKEKGRVIYRERRWDFTRKDD